MIIETWRISLTSFACRVHRNGETCVLYLSGELDLAAREVIAAAAASALADRRTRRLAVDCVKVTFIDCVMLGVLLDLNARAAKVGKCLTLRKVPDCMCRLLALTGAGSALPRE